MPVYLWNGGILRYETRTVTSYCFCILLVMPRNTTLSRLGVDVR